MRKSSKYILVNICRLLVATTCILSGFVKAIDPLGTQYKLHDYATALHIGNMVPDWLTLSGSIALSAFEFVIGILLLFAINRRIVSRIALVFIGIMTLVTIWIAIWEPVKDCGCFGDAIPMTGVQTLMKNIVLLGATAVTATWPLEMTRFISETNQGIVFNYSVLFIFAVSLWCLYDLPLFDFRPYHVGADIKAGMSIPEGAELPKYETTFILEKEGERREFTLADYPDSTWQFIDSRTVQTADGYVPPIHDFSIESWESGEDLTDSVLNDPGYTFLLISPHLRHADDSNFGAIDHLYEYSQEHGYPFYCLTASDSASANRWRDITGAEYPFCTTDETTLKTIVRSNPGLLLLHNGIVVGKWSHNRLPSPADITQIVSKGRPIDSSATHRVTLVLLWFALPLLLLTLADRAWAWTQWLRRKTRQTNNPKTNNTQTLES